METLINVIYKKLAFDAMSLRKASWIIVKHKSYVLVLWAERNYAY